MSADHYASVKSLLDAALAVPAAEREALLADAPPAVAADVRQLLDAEGVLSEGFLDPDEGAPVLEDPSDDLVGERVGPWRVEAPLGEGGMGRVYTALRDDGAYEQAVALKVVKRGMDTDAVLRRFGAERRILARLDHPGIAQLLDGGTTTDGRPYFAMALVEGEPIAAYAERHALDVTARLRLLLQTAEAVAHAHRHLVVHRDLKPSNVLVSADDNGQPVVKLLDFGIARLLEDDGEGLTETGLRPMSRPYAAPEQIADEPITTATDVWALGVLLYELLTGRRPFRSDDRAGLETAILDASPTLPSAAASRDETTTSGTGPGLSRRLRGDLDAICLTALARDPERRYPTADAFAADLRRHLDGLPVEARPPAPGYRLRKFVSRHRAAVGVAAAALAVLVAGTAMYTVRLQAERDRAEAALAESEATTDFFVQALSDASPYVASVDSLTVLEVLETSAGRIDSALAGRPAIQGALLQTVGRVYSSLGRFEEADRALTNASRYLLEAHGPGSFQSGTVLMERARLVLFQGRAPEADSMLTEALAIFGTPTDSVGNAALLTALISRGSAHHWQNDLDGAVADYEQALALADRIGPSADSDRLNALSALAAALVSQGDLERALATSREGLAVTRRLFPDNRLKIAHARQGEGRALYRMGRFAEAEPVFRSVLAARERALGPTHGEVATDRSDLAQALYSQGKTEAADSLLALVLPVMEAQFGPASPYAGGIHIYVAESALARGDLASAEAAYRRAAAIFEPVRETFESRLRVADVGLAETLDLAGRPDAALDRLRSRYDLDDLLEVPRNQSVIGSLLAQTGDRAGVRHAQAGLDATREEKGADSWEAARARLHLARALRASGRDADAQRQLREATRVLRETRGARSAFVRATQA